MTPSYNLPAEFRELATLPERPRLLVVDDQPSNIQTLYEIFQVDHEVFMATGGEQALAFCRDNPPPDLILLDIVMPGMDGIEVCRRLKTNPKLSDIPVIFVTARSEPADETAALTAGGVDFIAKPVNAAVVRARVKTHLTLKAQADLLHSLVFLDGLTGVANRRRFDDTLEIEWQRCRRSGKPVTLLMMDIDHFKRYNDHYGHQAGDACLQKIAAAIKSNLKRSPDMVARYGGEEFVCLMPECDLRAGQAKAEGLLAALAALNIPHADSPTANHVALSIGIAVMYPTGENTPEALIAAADAALYEAKRNGRNRAAIAPLAG